jgi:hypothetical protein
MDHCPRKTFGPLRDGGLAAHFEKLRKDAAECKRISGLAADPIKRGLLEKLAERYDILAAQVERVIIDRSSAAEI